MTNELQCLIDRAAAGEAVPCLTLYYDTQDPADPGPAYRTAEEGGALELCGWGGPADGTEDSSYRIGEFFGDDGAYRGPDNEGVYPLFRMR
jgi:hypothetical protein